MPRLADLAVLTAVAASACGAPQGVTSSQKEERQSLAFDVSGRYVEDVSSGTPGRLTIANEHGYYDIAATLELRGGLAAADRAGLTAAVRRDDPGLGDADLTNVVGHVEAALARIELGHGATFTERGGENVALDHNGDSAELALRRTVDAVAQTAHAHYTVTASLYLTGHKGSPRLDFQTTPATDDAGRGAAGGKGLLLTLTRTLADPAGRETTTDVTRELQLRLGELVKY